MTTTVRAVYENDVPRAAEPLALPEGAAVELAVSALDTSSAVEEIYRRIRAARTPEELFAAANDLPVTDDGYDLIEALEENRRRKGRAPLYPPDDEDGGTVNCRLTARPLEADRCPR